MIGLFVRRNVSNAVAGVTGAASGVVDLVSGLRGNVPGESPDPVESAPDTLFESEASSDSAGEAAAASARVTRAADRSGNDPDRGGEELKLTEVDDMTAEDVTAAGSLRVRDGESDWLEAELTSVREELTSHLAELEGEIANIEQDLTGLMSEGLDTAGDDPADAGAKRLERDEEVALARSVQEMADQVVRALDRLEDGTYGICEVCAEPIGKARLQAFPRATLCLVCKQKQERR